MMKLVDYAVLKVTLCHKVRSNIPRKHAKGVHSTLFTLSLFTSGFPPEKSTIILQQTEISVASGLS